MYMYKKNTKNEVLCHHRLYFQKKRGILQNTLSHVIIENGTSESLHLYICLLYSEERALCYSSCRHCT